MFKDFIDSFRGNITRRVTNPFLGTFAVVFLAYYWKPIYAMFTFDEGVSLQVRISYLENFFGEFSWAIFGILVFYTLLALIITYVLLALSALISNFYSKVITPAILKFTDKGSTVPKDVHEVTLDMMNKYIKKYEEERHKVTNLRSEIENLTSQAKDSDSTENLYTSSEISENPLFSIAYKDLVDSGYAKEFIKIGNEGEINNFVANKYPELLRLLEEYSFISYGKKTLQGKGHKYHEVSLNESGREFHQFVLNRYSLDRDKNLL